MTVEKHGEETSTGVLTMTFRGLEPVGGYNASVFHVANTVPEEPSNYKLILANTGDFMEKKVTKDNRSCYAKLLPINPQKNMMWSEGASLLTNISIPSNPGLAPYYITGVEDIEVPAGNFRCSHVKARYDVSDGPMTVRLYVDEWWDEERRGLIQARYKDTYMYKVGLIVGVSSPTWEYKLNNLSDSMFPINYMGI
jgi:hypothetical protein